MQCNEFPFQYISFSIKYGIRQSIECIHFVRNYLHYLPHLVCGLLQSFVSISLCLNLTVTIMTKYSCHCITMKSFISTELNHDVHLMHPHFIASVCLSVTVSKKVYYIYYRSMCGMVVWQMVVMTKGYGYYFQIKFSVIDVVQYITPDRDQLGSLLSLCQFVKPFSQSGHFIFSVNTIELC